MNLWKNKQRETAKQTKKQWKMTQNHKLLRKQTNNSNNQLDVIPQKIVSMQILVDF